MSFTYELTSVRISPFCELSRWVLEHGGFPYKEECHAPIFNIPFTRMAGGSVNVPAIKTPTGTMEALPFLEYLDALTVVGSRLYPSDPDQRREVASLVESFFKVLAVAVRLYAYSNMLPNGRVTGRLMTDRAPAWEGVLVRTFYPLQRMAMEKVLKINPESTEKARQDVLAAFQNISGRLGDRLTAADLTFAAATGPILLPPEYDAPLPTLADVPQGMKDTVLAVQQTPAGKLALGIYRDHRRAVSTISSN
jgi:glutathione S-transferase